MNQLTECVWDYPRPPRIEANRRHLLVVHEGRTLAQTDGGWRLLETSHPPCFYLPPEAVDWTRLAESSTVTFCEFKGRARYWSLRSDDGVIPDVCWSYPDPVDSQGEIAGHVSFYAGRVDACYVDGERVRAQEGSYYGGWITSGIEGPFKGGPGTVGW